MKTTHTKRIWTTAMVVMALAVAPRLAGAVRRSASQRTQAAEILTAAGVKGGLVVHIGCGDGRLTAALRANDSFMVHGLDADADDIENARRYIRSLGLYGRVSAEQFAGAHLPYADNIVNLVVSEDLGEVSMDEVMRVLAPNGAAYIRRGEKWKKTVKPWPEEIDEWTHWLHDADGNAVANDRLVGPPRHLQWAAKPLWSRHHDTVPSVSAMVSSRGRLFYISDEAPPGIDGRLPDKWFLVARDAFNGVLLWKRPMPEWGWSQWSATWHGRFNQPTQLPKRLVAVGEEVYVTLGFNAPLTALDAATGRVLKTYEGTECTDEILYHNGLLVLSVNKVRQRPANAAQPPIRKSVCVLEAASGKMLWKKGDYAGLRAKAGSPEPFGRLGMAVGDGRIFLTDSDAIVGLDLSSGDEVWRTPRPSVKDYVALFGMRMSDLCVLVYHKGIVLFAQPQMQIRDPWHSIPGTLYGYSADSGELLWQRRYGGWMHFGQPDVFVIDGLVWIHEHQEAREGQGKTLKKHLFVPSQDKLDYTVLGLDPATGRVERRFSTRETFDVGHHHRCYRNKATTRFLLTSRRGVEFLDLESGRNDLNHWARGGCLFGIMPCNGLLYLTPHPCDCYIATKLNGFFALAPRAPDEPLVPQKPVGRPLERGPAYKADSGKPARPGAEDWPTYRHDPSRSGSTKSAVPTELRILWQAEIGDRPSAVTAAGGRLFASSIDEHRVIALDASDGKPVWSFTAGGRVDTPPTIYQGLVLFGSADGRVYCLRASDGQVVWRRQAAPERRLVGSFGQFESTWPVHGSILVRDLPASSGAESAGAAAYLAAGRSSYLDGGIYVYALDPRTGELLSRQVIYSPDPETDKMPPGDARTIPGALADILVSNGSSVYMRQMKVLDGGREDETHVLSTAGLLDETWFNRTQWAVGSAEHAQLLVFDDDCAYGVEAYPSRSRKNIFSPGEQGYLLFANQLKPAPRADRRSSRTRGAAKAGWQVRIPIRITAMVLADRTLFVAGTPDVVDPADPLGALEGRKGGLLRVLSASDGKLLAEYKLESAPVWDGMAASDGRLYISTRKGRLLCMGKNE